MYFQNVCYNNVHVLCIKELSENKSHAFKAQGCVNNTDLWLPDC